MLLKKRVRVLLRENRHLEGQLHMAEGQSLISMLGVKRAFLNLTDAHWIGGVASPGVVPHLALRMNQIIWVQPVDTNIRLALAAPATSVPRRVELHLVGNTSLYVKLNIAEEQRMSDYFDSNPGFVPLRDAQITGGGEVYRQLAVNSQAILAIRELDSAPADEEQPEEVGASAQLL